MINQLDAVALTEDVPDARLRAGNVGTVLEVFTPTDFLVEFADKDGRAFAIKHLKAEQLLKLLETPKADSLAAA